MSPSRRVAIAVAFEAGLGVLALGAGALLQHSPLTGPGRGTAAALLVGVLAALPPFAALLLADRLPVTALRQLRSQAQALLPELLGGVGWAGLLAVSLAAGFGEELLFRGLVQSGVERWLGGTEGQALGLLIGALLFGAAHPISRAYAVVATLIGLYLGGLMLLTGSVLAPIAAHALYDFLALGVLLRPAPAAGVPAADAPPAADPAERLAASRPEEP